MRGLTGNCFYLELYIRKLETGPLGSGFRWSCYFIWEFSADPQFQVSVTPRWRFFGRALNVSLPGSFPDVVVYFSNELRTGLQCIAKITEMIHVVNLLRDDVLDDTDTRHGVCSLNFLNGNKLCPSRRFSAFSSLCRNCLS